jgi:hypothetical protein
MIISEQHARALRGARIGNAGAIDHGRNYSGPLNATGFPIWSTHRESNTGDEARVLDATDREAGLLAGVCHDTMTEWRKDPEFSEAIEKATAERLVKRLERIGAGEQGWQGTAWELERIYPHRFARPEIMNQIAVVQAGKVPERVIVLAEPDFDALKSREDYRQRGVGDLERLEGSLRLCDRPAAK